MIYISKYSKKIESSSSAGYWAHGETVYDATLDSHIGLIVEKPELFHLTSKEITDTFEKYGEKLNVEGKAREELIKKVSKEGWIRVRHYQQPENYWSIQCDDVKKRKETIKNFIYWAIEHKIMQYDDSAIILGYDHPQDREIYDWSKGGIKEFLLEKKKCVGTGI